jgi:hypothetical protein
MWCLQVRLKGLKILMLIEENQEKKERSRPQFYIKKGLDDILI